MAVDVKTLRVGSHINLCGKRQRIMAIDAQNGLIGVDAYKTDENGVKHPLGYKVEDIEPISITPEILKELGFEWREDSSCWRKYQNYDGERYDWGIYAYGCEGGTWCFSLYLPNFLIKPQLYAQHLHELEGQLAYYGVELIKE